MTNVQDDDRVFRQLIKEPKRIPDEWQGIDRWTLPQMLSFRNNREPLDGFAYVRLERGSDNLAKTFATFGTDV